MTTETEQHILHMSCETAHAVEKFWDVTVFCLIVVGILINVVICIDMICQRIVTRNFANFFVFHLSLVDIIFRVLTIVPRIMLAYTDTNQSCPICKVLRVFNAMCGAAFFASLALIFGYVYRNATSPLKGMEPLSRVWVARAVAFVWLYAAASSCLLIESVCSVSYTDLPEVAPANMTEALMNCSFPRLCDLQRDWSGQASSTVYFVLGFCIPIAVIVTLSVKMHIHHRQIERELQNQSYKAEQRIVRMLVVLCIIVAVTWGPTSIIFMVRSYGHRIEQLSSDAGLGIIITAEILKFFNSLPNPLIFYCFMPNYRWCRFLRTRRSLLKKYPPKDYGATSVLLCSDTMW